MTAQLRVFAISRGFLFPGSNSHIFNPFDHVQSIRSTQNRITLHDLCPRLMTGFSVFFIKNARV